MIDGSYVALRDAERAQRDVELRQHEPSTGTSDGYLPDFLK
jgi:hypothetical protein